MPDKYHIKAAAAPGHFRRVGKFGSVDWREDCSRCTNCVKPRCLYDTYRNEAAYNRDPLAPGESALRMQCLPFLRAGLHQGAAGIARSTPNSWTMGDEYWTPGHYSHYLEPGRQRTASRSPERAIAGGFTGPVSTRIWTDMSEIVRPTRDGIHGREYISPAWISAASRCAWSSRPTARCWARPCGCWRFQLPVILDVPAWQMGRAHAWPRARIAAAKELKTLAVVPRRRRGPGAAEDHCRSSCRWSEGKDIGGGRNRGFAKCAWWNSSTARRRSRWSGRPSPSTRA